MYCYKAPTRLHLLVISSERGLTVRDSRPQNETTDGWCVVFRTVYLRRIIYERLSCVFTFFYDSSPVTPSSSSYSVVPSVLSLFRKFSHPYRLIQLTTVLQYVLDLSLHWGPRPLYLQWPLELFPSTSTFLLLKRSKTLHRPFHHTLPVHFYGLLFHPGQYWEKWEPKGEETSPKEESVRRVSTAVLPGEIQTPR